MSNRKKPSGLRAALEAAKTRTEHYDIPIVDFDVAQECAAAVTEARASIATFARLSDDEGVLAREQKRLDDAKTALAACFHRVTFRGLPPEDLDALTNEHPDPPEGQERPADHVEFIYHLAVASAVNGEDITAEDWKHYCDKVWSGPDASRFRNTVLSANQREFTHGIPKG